LVRYGNVSYDTGIGIFFSFSMALGALFIAIKKDYTFNLNGYLFGNILGITNFDLVLAFLTLLIFFLFIICYFQKILFMTFDEKVAKVSGIKTNSLDTILLLFLAFIIVISIKIVGIILISALVVLPASFGILFFNSYRKVILLGILYSFLIMAGGLFTSYFLDTPAGATMVTLGTLIYFIGFIIKHTGFGRN
jgi:zinc transport system permease protein